jgi:hypothetical protein
MFFAINKATVFKRETLEQFADKEGELLAFSGVN